MAVFRRRKAAFNFQADDLLSLVILSYHSLYSCSCVIFFKILLILNIYRILGSIDTIPVLLTEREEDYQ